jgi:hypothetical protein
MCLSNVQSLFIYVEWRPCVVLVKRAKVLKWRALFIVVCVGGDYIAVFHIRLYSFLSSFGEAVRM